jgi:two-component system response regulator YesN
MTMLQEPVTVLIVDDEIPIREQLRSFPWETWGAVLIGEAEDGEEALELCRDCKPDVVVTDITMPIMDGMELLRRLHAELPQTKVILLTCHSEFQFAQEGLRLGATEYLVKVSLKESELEAAVSRSKELLRRERLYTFGQEELRRWESLRQFQEWRQERDRDDARALVLLGSEGKPAAVPGTFVCLHLEVNHREKTFMDREVQLLLAECVPLLLPGWGWKSAQAGDYVLQPAEGAFAADSPRQALERLAKRVRELLERRASYLNSGMRLVGWVSPQLGSAREYGSALAGLMDGLQASFYWGTEEVWSGGLPQLSVLTAADVQHLEVWTAKYEADRDALLRLLRGELAEWLREKRFEPLAMKHRLLPLAMRWCKHAEAETQGAPGRVWTEALLGACTLQEWIETVAEAVEAVHKPVHAPRIEVQRTKQIVAERIAEPITLQSIAREVGLTPHYLGKLFRLEVGEPFQDYVTRKRIEKAIVLLQTTNAKVYEIADQVGIASYRYFSMMFREYTGHTPTEFKRG